MTLQWTKENMLIASYLIGELKRKQWVKNIDLQDKEKLKQTKEDAHQEVWEIGQHKGENIHKNQGTYQAQSEKTNKHGEVNGEVNEDK